MRIFAFFKSCNSFSKIIQLAIILDELVLIIIRLIHVHGIQYPELGCVLSEWRLYLSSNVCMYEFMNGRISACVCELMNCLNAYKNAFLFCAKGYGPLVKSHSLIATSWDRLRYGLIITLTTRCMCYMQKDYTGCS